MPTKIFPQSGAKRQSTKATTSSKPTNATRYGDEPDFDPVAHAQKCIQNRVNLMQFPSERRNDEAVAGELRQIFADHRMYLARDITGKSGHEFAIANAKQMIGLLLEKLNPNDLLALRDAICSLFAVEFDPAAISSQRAQTLEVLARFEVDGVSDAEVSEAVNHA